MNILSSFSLYEIFRVLIPGFYSVIMITDTLNIYKVVSEQGMDNFGFVLLFTIAAILFGGFLYALDIPRWFSKCFPSLPSNLIKKNKDLANPPNGHNRFEENEYFKFYYKHSSDSKYKTEIQSGFFHLFINISFVSLIGLLVYAIASFYSKNVNPFVIINFIFFIISVLSAFIIYHQKLKYSWQRNYEEFLICLKGTDK